MEIFLYYVRKLDDVMFLFLNGHHWPIIDKMMPLITLLGDGITLTLLSAAVFLALKQYKDLALKLFVAYCCTGVVVQLIKHTVHRLRPAEVLANVHVIGTTLHYNSFPSGHTAAAFTAAMILADYYPGYSGFLFVVALLVGYSRIYLGAHFPVDVLAGALMGMVMGKLILWYTRDRLVMAR